MTANVVKTTPDKLRRLHRIFFGTPESALTVAASEYEQLEEEILRLLGENERIRALLNRVEITDMTQKNEQQDSERKLASAIKMVVNMLERDGKPVRAEAAGELLAAYGEYRAALSLPSAIRAQAMEESARITEGFCACYDSEQQEETNWVLRQRAARIRSLASQPVQDGYVLVPVEPTEEMIAAIENEIDNQLTASAMSPADMFRQDGEYVYRAMLSAAPTAAQRKGEENA